MALTNEELQQILDNLTPEERKQLQSQLNRQVDLDNITNPTDSTNTEPPIKPKSDNSKVYCCPLCGSASYKKHGTTSTGMQRYICKDCGKTFSENYGDSLRYSHLTSDEWLNIIRGIVNNHSLPQISRDCGISKSTAWSCRMKINQNADKTFLYERLKKEFNTMKFDVVIGNPPYNKGMDLDFVDLGYKLSNKYTVMITPAKWQTAADDYSGCASKNINYKQFREMYVPHMSYVCFYPACKDVFDILQVDGITWYLLDKCVHEQCVIENKCRYTKAFNSCEKRSIKNRESLFNIGNEIVKYLGNYNIFTFPYQYEYKHFQVWTNTQVPGGGLSTQIAVRKTQFVGESHIEEDNGFYIEHSNASICSFSSDSKAECESFISWLNCKFTRFFVAINPTKLTGIITNDNFRFVPAPPTGKFDHIYTDEELYKAFNLPQKYIDVIESVIKEADLKF